MMGEWKTVELGDLVTLASGGSFPVKYQGNTDGDYNFFKVSDMNLPQNQKYMVESTNTIDENVKEKLRSKIHPKNTIIFPKVGAALLTNKRRLLIEPSAFDNNIMGVTPNEKVDFNYLYYYMLTVDFRKLSQTGAIPSVNNTIVSSLPIDLPTNKIEQQKIAAILSSVDEAIEKTEQIIEQTEEVKKGLMQELLTKGIGHTEFKESPFGEIPKDWTTTLISDVATVNPEQLNSKTDDDYVMNYIDISSIENHEISETSVYKFKNAPGRARRIVKTDDIIVSTVRPYLKGFTYIQETHDNFICSTGFSVIRCKDVCLSNYLYHVILSDRFINYLITNMTGSSFPAVRADDVKNFHFPLPPLNEQIEIANLLDQYQMKVSNERKKISNLRKIKQGLMQELLTGKKRVKIDDSEEVLS